MCSYIAIHKKKIYNNNKNRKCRNIGVHPTVSVSELHKNENLQNNLNHDK